MIELQPNLELTTDDAQRLLEAWLGSPVVCSKIRRLEGGLVNTVLQLDFDGPPHRAVVKMHGSHSARLASEARALEFLRAETACPVPRVFLQDSSARMVPYAFLLMEHIPGVRLSSLDLEPDARADIDAQLAEVLGELHSHRGTRWGGIEAHDEPGAWEEVFVARLVEARSHPAVVERLPSEVLARVDEATEIARYALCDTGAPTLVHGDVWDGNVMARFENRRWRLTGLLDPDLQFADVEYELAYLEVFDTERDAFMAAYRNRRELRPGYEQRRLFYWLHTSLVHVGLFGDDYYRLFTARTAEQIAGLQHS